MRFISATIAAALFAVFSFGVSAAPVTSTVQGAKAPSTFELIAKKKKSAKKKKKSKKKGSKAGKCGTGKFYKKGKCVSASDKK